MFVLGLFGLQIELIYFFINVATNIINILHFNFIYKLLLKLNVFLYVGILKLVLKTLIIKSFII